MHLDGWQGRFSLRSAVDTTQVTIRHLRLVSAAAQRSSIRIYIVAGLTRGSEQGSAHCSRRRFFLLTGGVGLAVVTAGTAAALPRAAAQSAPLTVNFADYGACDGTTNDAGALRTALSELADAGGGTLLLPPKEIAVTLTTLPTFKIPANVQIVGHVGATKFLISSAQPDVWMAFAGSRGNNVSIEGVMFERSSDCTMIFFYPGGYADFHLRNCVIDGQHDTTHARTVHGLSLEQPGAKANISLRNCVVTRVNFGVLQSNEATSTVDNFVVDRCAFSGNFADDLEFNAPNATMTNVRVTNSRFTNNLSENAAASLGVGLAHVTNAVVQDCYFEHYYGEAIHLEDYCENVTITGNRISACGTNPNRATLTDLDRCGISVMSGSSNVTITGNILDHTANRNSLHGIVVKNLPGELTPGGRPNIPPQRVTISDNTITCGHNYQGMWITNVTSLVIRGNTVIGAGRVEGGAWNGGNEGFGIKVAGGNSVIEENTVRGFRYGISGPFMTLDNDYVLPDWSSRRALGNVGIVAKNEVSDCYLGLVAVPSGTLEINRNIISNCVRPLIAGPNEYNADSSSIVDNSINNCVFPPEVDGRQILLRLHDSSIIPPGPNRTVSVVDSFLPMPVGAVVTFDCGAALTLSEPVKKSHPYSIGTPLKLRGTVSVAEIPPDTHGVVTGLSNPAFVKAGGDRSHDPNAPTSAQGLPPGP